jgi:hypothetical protein
VIPWQAWGRNLAELWSTPAQRAEVITLAILVGLLVVIVIADRLGRRATRILHDRMIAQAADDIRCGYSTRGVPR